MHRNSGHTIRSRWILIGIMIVSLGVLSTMVASPPSPLVGIGFAASALIFSLALILAGRITNDMERARRAARSPIEAHTSFPILSRDGAPIQFVGVTGVVGGAALPELVFHAVHHPIWPRDPRRPAQLSWTSDFTASMRGDATTNMTRRETAGMDREND
jgi:hypothetical protein